MTRMATTFGESITATPALNFSQIENVQLTTELYFPSSHDNQSKLYGVNI